MGKSSWFRDSRRLRIIGQNSVPGGRARSRHLMRTNPAFPSQVLDVLKRIKAGHSKLHSSKPWSREPMCHFLSWRSSGYFSPFPIGSRHQKSLHLHWTVTGWRFLERVGESADLTIGALRTFQKASAGLLKSDRCILQQKAPPVLLCCWGRVRDLAL